MIYGYARVSTTGQDLYGNGLTAQSEQLKAAGAETIFSEAYTGTKRHRPELDRLLRTVKNGDTLVVAKLDRIARSARDGIELVDELTNKGVAVHILNMGLIDNSPTGKLMRTIMFAFAEFERDMIVQRTAEGKAIARTKPGYKEGRKTKPWDADLYRAVQPRVDRGELTVTEAAKLLGVSRAKYYRILETVKHGTPDSTPLTGKA